MVKITRTRAESIEGSEETVELSMTTRRVKITPENEYDSRPTVTVEQLIGILSKMPQDRPVWVMNVDHGGAMTIPSGPREGMDAPGSGKPFVKIAEGGEVVIGVSKHKYLPEDWEREDCIHYNWLDYPSGSYTTHGKFCRFADPKIMCDDANTVNTIDNGWN